MVSELWIVEPARATMPQPLGAKIMSGVFGESAAEAANGSACCRGDYYVVICKSSTNDGAEVCCLGGSDAAKLQFRDVNTTFAAVRQRSGCPERLDRCPEIEVLA